MPASSSALRRLRGVRPEDELESRRADNVAAGNENVGGVWCVVCVRACVWVSSRAAFGAPLSSETHETLEVGGIRESRAARVWKIGGREVGVD